jgi:choline dehydrogenase-like flavoprotein
MIYNRGQRADYDEIERRGNPGWGWDTMLPIFKQIENNELGASDVRGWGGPLNISTAPEKEPLCEQMIEAGVGLTRMRELFETDPLARLIEAEILPGPGVRDERAVLDAALDHGYCGYHAMGTCAMGPDEDDVVDPQLRVRGVEGLRVVASSVLPVMVSGNLNGPTMATGRRAADLITQALVQHAMETRKKQAAAASA